MAASKKPKISVARKTEPKLVSINEPLFFPIDWDKVENLEDIKLILSNMGLGCYNTAPNYSVLFKYLSDKPILIVE